MHRYFDNRGFLPEGIHQKTWSWFDSIELDDWRQELLRRAKIFCRDEFADFNEADGRLFLAGSFFSDKIAPSDIEILLKLNSDPKTLEQYQKAISILALHDKIEDEIKLDVWLTFPLITDKDFDKWFQYVGEKSAKIKGLHEKDLRGIIEVTQWKTGLV